MATPTTTKSHSTTTTTATTTTEHSTTTTLTNTSPKSTTLKQTTIKMQPSITTELAIKTQPEMTTMLKNTNRNLLTTQTPFLVYPEDNEILNEIETSEKLPKLEKEAFISTTSSYSIVRPVATYHIVPLKKNEERRKGKSLNRH